MKTHLTADPVRYARMTTGELREAFLIDSLAAQGEVRLCYVDLDRALVGMVIPLGQQLALSSDPALRSEYFLERRELGALNIGGNGKIRVDSETYSVKYLDCLYVGRGKREVFFDSDDATNPAVFYLLSYPAHCAYPVTLVRKDDARPEELGSKETCNHRVVYKYIYLGGAKSCQLVMGATHLRAASVWNTMPPHTHMRRSEIYMYFNLGSEDRVMHFMGLPDETRHIVMSNREVVVSPGWSIHAGVGNRAYSFCWGMGGENQDYADMDAVPIERLR